MVRALRIEYPGAFYHVMSHGNGFQWIYKNDINYKIFLDLFLEIKEKYNVKIHSYIFMQNHYHILIETPLGNLSRTMLYFNREFARRFNNQIKRRGSVLKSRYKAVLIEKEEYYLNLVRYISQNPIRAGICHKVENYPGGMWYYLKFKNNNIGTVIKKIVEIDEIKKITRMNKLELILNWLNEIEQDLIKKHKYKYILGTRAWIEKIKDQYVDTSNLNHSVIEHSEYYKTDKSIWKLFRKMQVYKNHNQYTNIKIYFMYKYTSLSQKEIAEKLALNNSNIVGQRLYWFQKKLNNDNNLKKVVEEIRKSKI